MCFLHHHHRVFLESQNVKLLVQWAVLTLVVVVLDDCLNEAINSEVRTSQQTVCVVGSVRGKIRGVSQCLSVSEARQVRSEEGRHNGQMDKEGSKICVPRVSFLLLSLFCLYLAKNGLAVTAGTLPSDACLDSIKVPLLRQWAKVGQGGFGRSAA